MVKYYKQPFQNDANILVSCRSGQKQPDNFKEMGKDIYGKKAFEGLN